jgi:hypothetical protein
MAAVLVSAMLGACAGGSGGKVEGATGTDSQAQAITLAAPTQDAAVANQRYEFEPDAGDLGGAPVSFAVAGKPSWAQFDPTSGTLSGTPGAADVGTTTDVTITGQSGGAQSSVTVRLSVIAAADRVADVTIDVPAVRTDGTPLANLAGYRIYYGKTANRLDQFIEVPDPTVSAARVSTLTPGDWYFAATAYDVNGFESDASAVQLKSIG